MSTRDIISLLILTAAAVMIVGPIIAREIKRGGSYRPSLGNLGGLARTPEDKAVIEEFDRVFHDDPAAAQQLLHDHFAKEDQQEEEQRAALRQRAKTDPAAAEQFRLLLREDLEVWQHLLKSARKKAKKDETSRKAIPNLEKWERETRIDLDEVEALIHRQHGVV